MSALNEHGVPLHACHGVRQDAHYWAWVGHQILLGRHGPCLLAAYCKTLGWS